MSTINKTTDYTEEPAVNVEDLQAGRKTALRTTLAKGDRAGCWARMVPCQAESPDSLIAEEGDVVRQDNVTTSAFASGPLYSFLGQQHDYYLALEESAFSITWTRSELEEKMQKLLETEGKEEEYSRVLAEYNRVLAGVYTDYTEEPAVNEEPPVNHVVEEEEEEEEEEELAGDLCYGASDAAASDIATTVIIYTMAGGGAHWWEYEVHYDDKGQQTKVFRNDINCSRVLFAFQRGRVLYYYEDKPDQLRLEDTDFEADG